MRVGVEETRIMGGVSDFFLVLEVRFIFLLCGSVADVFSHSFQW